MTLSTTIEKRIFGREYYKFITPDFLFLLGKHKIFPRLPWIRYAHALANEMGRSDQKGGRRGIIVGRRGRN